MYLIYGSDSVKSNQTSGFPTRIWQMDSVHHYITHYGNFLYLKFISNHSDSSRLEKQQALKEISIASKKCDLWFKVAKSQQRLAELHTREQDLRKHWNERN